MLQKLKTGKAILIGLALGAIPLVTIGSCDPVSGAFNFFRDTDNYGYTDGYYDGGFFYDPYYYDDGFYYNDFIYYDDCYYGCY